MLRSLVWGIILWSQSVVAGELVPAVYYCGYGTDPARGIVVPRIRLEILHGENDLVAKLSFFDYAGGGRKVMGASSGVFNRRHGIRRAPNGGLSARFDGFEDFVSQSHNSIPPAKRRFGIFEFEREVPLFSIKRDRRLQPDLEYECRRK